MHLRLSRILRRISSGKRRRNKVVLLIRRNYKLQRRYCVEMEILLRNYVTLFDSFIIYNFLLKSKYSTVLINSMFEFYAAFASMRFNITHLYMNCAEKVQVILFLFLFYKSFLHIEGTTIRTIVSIKIISIEYLCINRPKKKIKICSC